ncbi:MAG: class I SAM-dependent methyltransferase [Desulfomonilaceae bacterium]
MKNDREKWDLRYYKESGAFPAPDEFLLNHDEILRSGRALDVACGRGGNTIFLAERGYSVDAVDISFQALYPLQAEAVRRELDIRCVVVDLDTYPLPRDLYDLVIVFYFFSKPLMRSIRDALKEGGLIFYATFNERHTSVRPEFNPAYLIPPDGLYPYFHDFDILVHETAAGENENVSHLIGRKPAAEF